jgi:flagellin
MPIQINSNINSLVAQKNLLRGDSIMSRALERLSSGKQVNSAKDDAAGLAIAQALDAQLRGLEQAARNTNEGISLAQTADAAVSGGADILQRMRELSVQAASDTNSPEARGAIQAEMDQLASELGRIGGTASFNGMNLLDGSFAGRAIQVGANAGQTVEINIDNLSPAALGVNSLDVATQAGASNALSAIDVALGKLGETRAGLGAVQNRLEGGLANLSAAAENAAASKSRIIDADFAAETAERIRGQILERASIAALGQANISPRAALGLLGA